MVSGVDVWLVGGKIEGCVFVKTEVEDFYDFIGIEAEFAAGDF